MTPPSDRAILTDLQREIAATQRDMEAHADDLAGKPGVALFWRKLNDFGEKWIERVERMESEADYERD